MEEAFYLDPRFWVAVSFVVFVAMAFKPLGRAFSKVLDARSTEIALELEEARRLREEAQAMLQLYRQKQQDSLKEAEALLRQAREDADQIAFRAEAELKTTLAKRTKMAADRIAQSEAGALQEVRNHVVDIAIAAARALIQEHLARSGGKELISQAAEELKRKLH